MRVTRWRNVPALSSYRQDSYHPLLLLCQEHVSMMPIFPTPLSTREELEHINRGTVDAVHRDVKQRFFAQVPEVLRIRIDVKRLVGLIRGNQYVRLQTMRGEDFTYVIVRSSLHLYSFRLRFIFETLTYFLKEKFAIDVCAADLSVELPRRAPVSVSYSLLDILFICLVMNDEFFPIFVPWW